MAFGNPVVGGNKLIRDAIQSPNYVLNTSGWTINRDGSAEFNDVVIRGGLVVGTPPSPPNSYIQAEVLAGVPTIAIYDGVHATPARIRGYDLGGNGGLVLDTGDPAIETAGLALGGSIAELQYENSQGTLEFALIKAGPPFNEAIKLRATGGGSQDLELGFDMTNPTPDGIAGRLYTFGEIKLNSLSPDSNYPVRVVDGKGPAAILATAIGTADTSVATVNIQNTYLQDGFAYRATIHIDYANANVGGRLDFKLWDGAVGGVQLGGTSRRWTIVSSSTTYGGTVLVFMWRQIGTGVSANLNISAAKTVVTAGVANVQMNGAYSAVVEQIGDANMIGGL